VSILVIGALSCLAGLLAASSVWSAETFPDNVVAALKSLPASQRIDLGCSLEHGAFEQTSLRISEPSEALIFFMLRLLDRLRALGTAPTADFMEYGRSLRSFRR
jgi:hypothetical protein